MKKLFSIIPVMFLIQGIFAQTIYLTIADGNWSSLATWKDGKVPSATISNNAKIIITKKVNYNIQSDLEIKKGSLEIYEGELKFPTSGSGSNKSVFIRKDGKLLLNSGKLILPVMNASGGNNSGNLNNEGGKIDIHSSIVEVAQNWQASGNSNHKIVLSCIRVGENYQNASSFEIIDRSCIEIGLHGSGNFDNDNGDIRLNLVTFLLHGTSGNFSNKSSTSKIRKYGNSVMAFSRLDVNGNLENVGIWDAPIERYCVRQNIQGSRSSDIDFTGVENCNIAETYYCDCTGPQINESVVNGAQFNYYRGDCEPDICALPVNYFFDSTLNGVNIPWTDVNGYGNSNGKLTIGGHDYTEDEGRKIFDTPNNNGVMPDSKKGFIHVATLKLSKTNYALHPGLLANCTTIEAWLLTCGKLSPTNLPVNIPAVSSAANYIQQWIQTHGCEDRR